MIIKARKNPTTCEELSTYLGYPVRSWKTHPDGSFELDIDLPSLTSIEKKALKRKLLLMPLHLVIEGEGNTYDTL